MGGRVALPFPPLRLNSEFYDDLHDDDLHDMTRASQPGPIIVDPRAMAECEHASGWHIAHLARSPKGHLYLGQSRAVLLRVNQNRRASDHLSTLSEGRASQVLPRPRWPPLGSQVSGTTNKRSGHGARHADGIGDSSSNTIHGGADESPARNRHEFRNRSDGP